MSTDERRLTEDYYIDCLVNDVKVATLHVSKDLSTYASIYTNDNGTGVIFASFGFTLKRALKKAKRSAIIRVDECQPFFYIVLKRSFIW